MKHWFLFSVIALISFSCNPSSGQRKNNMAKSKSSVTTNLNNSDMKKIIVDVRTKEEWEHDGHADCSVNYPLDNLMDKLDELKKYNSITLVCRSGVRASHAEELLYSAGIKNIENKGSWKNIDCK
jgi:rhodanese-related sulfurtransferase